MYSVNVQIVRFTDASQPGCVECVLRDALDREWLLIDKVPIFADAYLDENSSYPQPGGVGCEIVREWTDEHGRQRCIITTERPYGVTAQNGVTEFEVFRDQVTCESHGR